MCCIQLIGSPAMNIPRVPLLPRVCRCSRFPAHGSPLAPLRETSPRPWGGTAGAPPSRSAAGTPAFYPVSLLSHPTALTRTSVTKNKPPHLRDLQPSHLATGLRPQPFAPLQPVPAPAAKTAVKKTKVTGKEQI